jgi:hypothetical protein
MAGRGAAEPALLCRASGGAGGAGGTAGAAGTAGAGGAAGMAGPDGGAGGAAGMADGGAPGAPGAGPAAAASAGVDTLLLHRASACARAKHGITPTACSWPVWEPLCIAVRYRPARGAHALTAAEEGFKLALHGVARAAGACGWRRGAAAAAASVTDSAGGHQRCALIDGLGLLERALLEARDAALPGVGKRWTARRPANLASSEPRPAPEDGPDDMTRRACEKTGGRRV